MKIAIEFDGTIVRDEYPGIGKELPMATFIISSLIELGHQVILYTHRSGKELEVALRWCEDYDIEFWAVNKNYPGENSKENECRKINADLFIDGRNLGGIPQWTTIFKILHPEESDFLRLRIKYEQARFKKKLKTLMAS